jgi:hypothetical protein
MLDDVDAFGPYAAGVLSRGDSDLERHAGHWYRSADFQFAAVPFPALTDPDPLVQVLRAARIVVPEDQLVVGTEPVNITLGPVAVEAMRLLRTYLVGLNRSFASGDPAARRLHRIAARQTLELGWCEDEFWGWPPALAARAAEQLAPSNERFAGEVWGSAWPLEVPVDRPPTRVQLLKLPTDQLDRVHDFVIAMAKRYATLRAGPAKA